MATEYSTNATLPSDVPTSQPAGFPSAKVCCLINSQSITAQYSASIRFHINGTKHRAHLQQTQPEWKSDRVWDSIDIDMQGLGLAFKSLDTLSCHFTSKMLHGWLNTGHQHAKLTKDPSSSLCPCYSSPDETFEHILRCTAPLAETARKDAQTKLSSISKKLRSTTWDVLYKALCNWLKFGNQMQHPCLDGMFLKAGQRTLIETALQKQDKIGWKYAMRGYLSTSWVDMDCYGKSGATPDSVQQNWLQPIIKAIWAFNKTMWTHCNSILHSTTIPLCELRESSVNSQIQSLYNQQQDFAVLDQVIFDTPLEAMLQRPLRSKKHWIRLAKQYHPWTHDRKTGNQLLITGFFPKAADIRQPRPNCLHKRSQPQPNPPRRNSPLPGPTIRIANDSSS